MHLSGHASSATALSNPPSPKTRIFADSHHSMSRCEDGAARWHQSRGLDEAPLVRFRDSRPAGIISMGWTWLWLDYRNVTSLASNPYVTLGTSSASTVQRRVTGRLFNSAYRQC